MKEVIAFFESYARFFQSPVRTGTTVLEVRHGGGAWRIETDRGAWQARGVVIATGHCDTPLVPSMSRALPDSIEQLTPGAYRNPAGLARGGVLVVGASASGVQIADELARAGREVTLAVGRHIRLPRRYRGRDIIWWLDRMGTLDQRIDQVPNLEAARNQPSLQLVGDDRHRSIDLGTLADAGVRIVGRAVAAESGRISFAGDLDETTGAAERKVLGLRARIDMYVERAGLGAEVPEAGPHSPLVLPGRPAMMDLRGEGIGTVMWATGFRRNYPWLKAPVLDHRDRIIHHGGITPAPGLCVLGLRFLRRRKSSFIDGVGDDAAALAEHLAAHLGARQRVAV